MILLAGATGSLGGRIARSLRDRGEPLCALVRPATDRSRLEAKGITIALGDLREPGTLRRACDGISVVVSTASATSRGDDTPDNVDAKGTANLVEAARDAGAEHFVLISTIGASPDSPVPAFRAKGKAEEAVRASGINYTIFQPNGFMDVWFANLIEAPIAAGRPVTLVGEARRRHSFIAERDVAAFAVAAALAPIARGETVSIGGPTAVSFRDAVAAYEAALGRPIPIETVPPGAPIPGVPEPVWGIAAAFDSYDSPMPMDETAARFGVQLTSLEEFAAERAAILRAR